MPPFLTPFGNKVAAYDKERSICDLLRNKERLEIHIFQITFKNYFEQQDKNILLLMQYVIGFKLRRCDEKYTEELL